MSSKDLTYGMVSMVDNSVSPKFAKRVDLKFSPEKRRYEVTNVLINLMMGLLSPLYVYQILMLYTLNLL